jgi:hypothetical protein
LKKYLNLLTDIERNLVVALLEFISLENKILEYNNEDSQKIEYLFNKIKLQTQDESL